MAPSKRKRNNAGGDAATVALTTPRTRSIEILLENILIHLPPAKILVLQRVCRGFQNVITTSKDIRKKLFIRAPDAERVESEVIMNPVLYAYQEPKYLKSSPGKSESGTEAYKTAMLNPFLKLGDMCRQDANGARSECTATYPLFNGRVLDQPSWHQTFLSDPPAREATITLHWRITGVNDLEIKGCVRRRVRNDLGLTFGDLISTAFSEHGAAFCDFLKGVFGGESIPETYYDDGWLPEEYLDELELRYGQPAMYVEEECRVDIWDVFIVE